MERLRQRIASFPAPDVAREAAAEAQADVQLDAPGADEQLIEPKSGDEGNFTLDWSAYDSWRG